MNKLGFCTAAFGRGIPRIPQPTITTLIHQIHNGALKATKLGHIWVVTEDEVERYRRESRGRHGKPRKG